LRARRRVGGSLEIGSTATTYQLPQSWGVDKSKVGLRLLNFNYSNILQDVYGGKIMVHYFATLSYDFKISKIRRSPSDRSRRLQAGLTLTPTVG